MDKVESYLESKICNISFSLDKDNEKENFRDD